MPDRQAEQFIAMCRAFSERWSGPIGVESDFTSSDASRASRGGPSRPSRPGDEQSRGSRARRLKAVARKPPSLSHSPTADRESPPQSLVEK
jgi:hypothetical protein